MVYPFFIGGYFGEWGEGEKVSAKRKLLSEEGVFFDKQGYLLRKLRSKVIFNDFLVSVGKKQVD